jgi:hypothetical protein
MTSLPSLPSLPRALAALGAFLLCAGFDSGGCDDDGEGQPVKHDTSYDADELELAIKIQMQPQPFLQVELYEHSAAGRSVIISASRFELDGVALRGDESWGAYLDDPAAGATLAYVDVDGVTHDLVIPPVPNTFVVVPATVPYGAPLEIAWDGAPMPPKDAPLVEDRLIVTLADEDAYVTHYAEPDASSVTFTASELDQFQPGPSPVTVTLTRETYTGDYPGTNGGFLSVDQRAPDVETTLE